MSIQNILVDNNLSIMCKDIDVSGDFTLDGNSISVLNEAHARTVTYTGDSTTQTKTLYFQRVNNIVNVLIPAISYTVPVGADKPGYFSIDISDLSDFTVKSAGPSGDTNTAVTVTNSGTITTGTVQVNTNNTITIKLVTSGSTGTNFTGTNNTSQGIPLQHIISYYH
ncbi:MAG TPA: hypothetical protein PKG56_00010 [Chitinophagaceae bacterium]|nr:hypothetical protein [Chitinophagaceae bacterium]